MSIRTLSIELDADTGKFSVSIRDAAGSMRELKGASDSAKLAVESAARSLDGSVASIRKYVEANSSLQRGSEAMLAAQKRFLAGLIEERDTLGMSAAELDKYTAKKLGLATKTATLRAELDRQRQTLAATARATAEAAAADELAARMKAQYLNGLEREAAALTMSAEEFRAYEAAQVGAAEEAAPLLAMIREKTELLEQEARATAQAAAEREASAASERQQMETAAALTNSLREQIVTLREGTDALLIEKAASNGCEAEVRELLNVIAQLNAAHKEAEATIRATAEAEREMAAESARLMSADRAEAEATNAFLNRLRERNLVLEHGTQALEREEAIRRGVLPLYDQEIAKFNELTERRKAEAAAAREQALADRAAGRSGHSGGQGWMGGGVTTEANRVMHELTSGRTNQALSSITILMNRLGVAGGVTLAIGAAVAAMRGMIEPTMEAANNIEKMARRAEELGMTLRSMQNLSIWGELAGLDPDKTTQAAGREIANFGRARQGSKPAQDAFQAVGVDIKQDYSPEQMLEKTADAFEKMPDGARKAQIAIELFGRAGLALIPVLDQGSAGLKQASQLADEYGVHNDKAAKTALQLAAANRENHVAMQGLAMTMMEAMGPSLTTITTYMNTLVGSFVASYQAGGTAKQIMDALVFTFKVTVAVVADLVTGFLQLLQLTAAVGNYMGGFFHAAWDELTGSIKEAGQAASDFLKVLGDVKNFDMSAGLKDTKALFDHITNNEGASAKQAAADMKSGSAKAWGNLTDIMGTGQQEANFVGQLMGTRQGKTYQTPKLAANDDDGTTAGMGFKADKTDRGETTLSQLNAQAAELQATLAGGGKELAKYTSLLGDQSTPLAKAAALHKGLAAQILAAAAAIDKLNDTVKSKSVYDDLNNKLATSVTAAANARRAMAMIAGGSTDDQVKNAQRDAEIQQQVVNSGDWEAYAKAHNIQATSASDLASQLIANDNTVQSNTTSASAFGDLRKRQTEITDQVNSQQGDGFAKLNPELDKYKASLNELVSKVLPEYRAQAEAIAANSEHMFATDQAQKQIADLKKANQALADSMITDPQARARSEAGEAIADKYKNYQASANAGVDAKTLQQEYAAYVQFVELQNKKIAQDNPIAEMANQWADLMGNMEKASTSWISSFVDDLMKGKMNFKAFAQDIIKQILQMAIQAMIARTIIQPLMSALGGGSFPTMGSASAISGFPSDIVGGNQLAGMSISAPSLPAVAFHQGGLVGGFARARTALTSWFAGAPKFHDGGLPGLQPNEVPAILQKGEGVFTAAQMAEMSSGGGRNQAPNVAVNINNQSGMAMDGDHAGTKFDGEKWVVDVVTSALNKPGPLRTALGSRK